jgi:ATP-dependent Lon protease
MFIATTNEFSRLSAPLRDRMEVIHLSSYTLPEKEHILKTHIIPKVMKETGIGNDDVVFDESSYGEIIEGYTREAGVRDLERKVAKIMGKVAVLKVRSTEHNQMPTQLVNLKSVKDYLGAKRASKKHNVNGGKIGVVNGLAYTSVGGELLKMEVVFVKGTGKIVHTGKLGDVMSESLKVATTAVKARVEMEANIDVHFHAPEGATPKDGPSAGITASTALYSAITKKPIPTDIAMTGEVTITGQVLAIGGLKEKLIAARNNNIKTVIVPDDNKSDVLELEPYIVDGLNIVYAQTLTDVFNTVFGESNV